MSSSLFWALAALLLALTLAPLLWALLRQRPATAQVAAPGLNLAVLRDQLAEAERDLAADVITHERFVELKAELERRVLEDVQPHAAPPAPAPARPARTTAVVLALALPLASVLAYRALGQPEALNPHVAAAEPEGDPAEMAKKMEAAVAQLAAKLKEKPDNPVGWHMLGRSYLLLQQPGPAVEALRQATAQAPDNPDAWADLADAVGLAQGAKLAGEPLGYIQKALALKPDHGKALALAGSAEFEAGRYAQARAQWEKLLRQVEPGSEAAQGIEASIAQARQREGLRGTAPAAPPAPATAADSAANPATASAGKAVSGEVSLSPALAAKAKPGDTVFVFARAAQGPRMPLAVLKLKVADLPRAFTLDDSQAMQPGMTISSVQQVVIGVRVSASGSASAQSGDLTGTSAPVAPGATGVKVVVDQVTP